MRVEFENIIDTRRKKVKRIGNSSHVTLPKNWRNKEVIVLLLGDKDE